MDGPRRSTRIRELAARRNAELHVAPVDRARPNGRRGRGRGRPAQNVPVPPILPVQQIVQQIVPQLVQQLVPQPQPTHSAPQRPPLPPSSVPQRPPQPSSSARQQAPPRHGYSLREIPLQRFKASTQNQCKGFAQMLANFERGLLNYCSANTCLTNHTTML